jgi:hypothetical protein
MSTIKEERFIHAKHTHKYHRIISSTIEVFKNNINLISIIEKKTSNKILAELRIPLEHIGYRVEQAKIKNEFLVNNDPNSAEVRFYVDAQHCCYNDVVLEIESSRAIGGNAIYRNIARCIATPSISCIIIAVPDNYKTKSGTCYNDYDTTKAFCKQLFKSPRFGNHFSIVIIGYPYS